MTREARIGMLLGLVLVLAFGMIMSEWNESTEKKDPAEEEKAVDTTYYHSQEPLLEEAKPRTPRPAPREVAERPGSEASSTIVSPRLSGSGMREATMRLRRQGPSTPRSTTPPSTPSSVRRVPEPTHRSTPAVTQAKIYTVKAGDSLSSIAGKFYGSNNRHLYKKIFEANRNKLNSPGEITPGQKIVIPPLGTSRVASRTGGSRVREMTAEELRAHFRSGQ